jgi:hypothetical protein
MVASDILLNAKSSLSLERDQWLWAQIGNR